MKNKDYAIKNDQLETIRRFIPDVDSIVDYEEFQIRLNDAIISELGEDYATTPNSRILQKLYDEIYEQN